eukprot:gb/GECH01008397.1/.p1 GENE.gb/GECH01008397.1/~~gb/GECH01008397.1/.p1  ORF type:complete len:513 (+),score=144.46 gb/GECH01008397.1/:1-1539(+)
MGCSRKIKKTTTFFKYLSIVITKIIQNSMINLKTKIFLCLTLILVCYINGIWGIKNLHKSNHRKGSFNIPQRKLLEIDGKSQPSKSLPKNEKDEIEDLKKQAGTLLGDPKMFSKDADDANTLEKMLGLLQNDITKNENKAKNTQKKKDNLEKENQKNSEIASTVQNQPKPKPTEKLEPTKKPEPEPQTPPKPSSQDSKKEQDLSKKADDVLRDDPKLNSMLNDLVGMTGKSRDNLLGDIVKDLNGPATHDQNNPPKQNKEHQQHQENQGHKEHTKNDKPTKSNSPSPMKSQNTEIDDIKKEAGKMLGDPDMFKNKPNNQSTLQEMLSLLQGDLSKREHPSKETEKEADNPKQKLHSENKEAPQTNQKPNPTENEDLTPPSKVEKKEQELEEKNIPRSQQEETLQENQPAYDNEVTHFGESDEKMIDDELKGQFDEKQDMFDLVIPQNVEDQMLMSIGENTIIASWLTDISINSLLLGIIVACCSVLVFLGGAIIQRLRAKNKHLIHEKDFTV